MVMMGSTAISIHNNKLYIITGEIPGLSQDIGGMYVVDLANADEYGFDDVLQNNKPVCDNRPHYKWFNEAIDVVTENIGCLIKHLFIVKILQSIHKLVMQVYQKFGELKLVVMDVLLKTQ